MTVYELMRELMNYEADTEVDFRFNGIFDTIVEAKFNRESELDVQKVATTVKFNRIVDFYGIDDLEYIGAGRRCITIRLDY